MLFRRIIYLVRAGTNKALNRNDLIRYKIKYIESKLVSLQDLNKNIYLNVLLISHNIIKLISVEIF